MAAIIAFKSPEGVGLTEVAETAGVADAGITTSAGASAGTAAVAAALPGAAGGAESGERMLIQLQKNIDIQQSVWAVFNVGT